MANDDFGMDDLQDILERPIPPIEYIVEDILRKNGITLLTAPRKSSKTLFTQYMSLCIANGKDVFGYKSQRATVLYLDLECGNAVLLSRFKALCEGNDLPAKGIKPVIFERVKLEGNKAPYWQQTIAKCIKKYEDMGEHVVVIVDTCVRTLDKGKENSSDDIRTIYSTIQPMLHNSSWILLHHTGKDENAGGRGSSEWEAFPDDIFLLKSLNKGQHVFRLASKWHRSGTWIAGIDFKITGDMKLGEGLTIEYQGKQAVSEVVMSKMEVYNEKIMEFANKVKKFTTSEIRTCLLDIPYASMTLSLNQLVLDKKLLQPVRGTYKLSE